MLRTFHEYVQQVRKNALKDKERAEKSYEEHAAIMEAIKNRQPDAAAMLATRHIENAVESWKVTDGDPCGKIMAGERRSPCR